MKKNLELESPQRFECLGQEWVMYQHNYTIRIEPDLDPEKYFRIPFIKVRWDKFDSKYDVELSRMKINRDDLRWEEELSLHAFAGYETLRHAEHLSPPSKWSFNSAEAVPDLVGQHMKKIVNEIDPPVERFSGEELIPDFCEEAS